MIKNMFDELVLSEDKDDTFFTLLRFFNKRGFSCELHVLIPDRGDGNKGRIDIIATKDDTKLAIMLDNTKPRVKSVKKLQLLTDNYIKCIICRVVGVYQKIKDFHIVYPRHLKKSVKPIIVKEFLPKPKPILVKKGNPKKPRDFEKKFRLIKS
jgi:hypothetical protein